MFNVDICHRGTNDLNRCRTIAAKINVMKLMPSFPIAVDAHEIGFVTFSCPSGIGEIDRHYLEQIIRGVEYFTPPSV